VGPPRSAGILSNTGREHPNREPSRRFLRRVREGKVDACTSTEVLQQILYRYASLGRLEVAREVYDLFVDICPIVLSVTLADTDRARDLICGAMGPFGSRRCPCGCDA